MVLVGNKCDLQAWAVDMNQARDVREKIKQYLIMLSILIEILMCLSGCRLPNNMECPLLKHLPRHGWVLMMHFTRLYVKFARIKSEGRRTENIKQWDHIADFDVSYCKNHTSTTNPHTHTQFTTRHNIPGTTNFYCYNRFK